MAARAQRRERSRVSYFLRAPQSVKAHCGGINALCLSGDNATLYTASRDATVRAWGVTTAQPRPEGVLEGHTDWVTAVSVLDAEAVVTASCDATVRLWRGRAKGSARLVAVLQGHRDYVTSVATFRGSTSFATGAFGGELFLWDAETLRPLLQAPTGVAPAPALPFSSVEGQKESIYSLAMASSTIVSGASDGMIKVFDARSNQLVAGLRGHTDNVRAIKLDPAGRMCLSGGSDGTVRLWDVGQQRCVQTICPMLGDSVWALATDDALSTVWSGGLEGRVYATVVSNRQSRVVLTESSPITALALNPATRGLWVGTTKSTACQWMADEPGFGSPDSAQRPASSGVRQSPGGFIAAGSPGVVMRVRESSLSKQQILALAPNQTTPVTTVPGVPGVVRAEMLSDKRTVLTRDSDGVVSLWDLANSSVAEMFGKVDFEEKKKELQKIVAMPAWCMLDVRLGHLGVHLEPNSAFAAEMYAAELGVEGATDDQKVNIGQQALLMITADAVHRKKAAAVAAVAASVGTQPVSALASDLPAAAVAAAAAGMAGGGDVLRGSPRAASSSGASADGAQPPPPPSPRGPLTPMAFAPPAAPPLVLYDGADGLSHWMARSSATSAGPETDLTSLPSWVVTCVLNRSTPVAESPKCSFMLISADPQDLPTLTPCKFSAPKVLRMQKVYPFVLEKLVDAGVPEPARDPGGAGPGGADAGLQAAQALFELFCNDQKIPLEMSLNTVQHFLWKKSDDLQIVYRRKGGGPGAGAVALGSGGAQASDDTQGAASSMVGGGLSRLRWLTGGSSMTSKY